MNFRLFFAIVALTPIHQSFSMALNNQLIISLDCQLLWAAGADQGDRLNEVSSLIQAGANIHTEDGRGYTPLHQAAMRGHTATAELLLSKGARINTKNHHGNTPLHTAASSGHTETVELLLSKGANVNAKDNLRGLVPLHWAAYIGSTEIAGLLLAHGADIHAKDKQNDTPLQKAESKNHATIVELLKAYQALLEQAEKPTKAALLKVAIEHGCYAFVKLLLQRGVKPEVSDLQLAKKKWNTAEHKKSYEAIGKLLIKKLSLLPKIEGGPAVGSISKDGIGLPKDIAQEIATFVQ